MKHSHFIIRKSALLTAWVILFLACGCSNSSSQATDTIGDTLLPSNEDVVNLGQDTLDWDADECPMPMYSVVYLDENYKVQETRLRHLFDFEKHKEYYTRRAANYTTMLCADKVIEIAYKGVHAGPEMGYWIGGEYCDNMSGLDYECKGHFENGFAFTDHFMKTHEAVPVNCTESKAPKAVIDTLQARYGTKVKTLQQLAKTKDGKLTVYWGQMEPQGKRCLGLGVVKAGDRLLVDEAWTEQYDEWSAWNVDDGGEYLPINVVAVTLGSKGYDIFYTKGTPESFRHGALMLRGNKIACYEFSDFYNYVDYYPSTE